MPKIEVDLVSTITAFSRAGDLNNLTLLAHAERVAYTAFRLGEKLGFSQEQLDELLLSALLHDIGVMTTQEKLELADLEPRPGITALHCRRGCELLKPTRLFGAFAHNVLQHHDYYTAGMRLVPAVIHAADRLDFLLKKDRYYLWQVPDILAYYEQKQGAVFHPCAVQALKKLAEIPAFWLDLQHGNHPLYFEKKLVYRRKLNLNELEEIAHIMATVVDSKSPFTGRHSLGVSRIAAFLGAKLGLPAAKAKLLEIAGLLHDVGKLAVPDKVLMHPGALNEKQGAIMKQHVYHTYYLLGQIGPGAKKLQEWAGYHHEHLDGSGYPFGLAAADLDQEARLMAVADIVQSLLEDRPYRPAMANEKITQILAEMVDAGHIDPELTALALACLNELKDLIQPFSSLRSI